MLYPQPEDFEKLSQVFVVLGCPQQSGHVEALVQLVCCGRFTILRPDFP